MGTVPCGAVPFAVFGASARLNGADRHTNRMEWCLRRVVARHRVHEISKSTDSRFRVTARWREILRKRLDCTESVSRSGESHRVRVSCAMACTRNAESSRIHRSWQKIAPRTAKMRRFRASCDVESLRACENTLLGAARSQRPPVSHAPHSLRRVGRHEIR